MLNTDASRFNAEGYCVFRNALNAAEVAGALALLERTIAEGAAMNLDRTSYYGEPHAESAEWLDLCRHPRVLDAVEAVLGPNLILIFSSLFIKRPYDGKPVPWHQDITYWPSIHGSGIITVWLAIDKADASNAAMKVIPRTHGERQVLDTGPAQADAMLSSEVKVTSEMEAGALTLELNQGDLSIHDAYILHASAPNVSPRRRAGYTIRFASADTAWVDTDQHPIPVFLMRGEAGEHGANYVDMRPGQAAYASRPSGAAEKAKAM